MDETSTMVFDFGSRTVYAGLAGYDAPSAIFPNVVGRPRYPLYMSTCAGKSYVGSRAMALRGVLHLQCPIERGVVTDWEAMEKVCDHVCYQQLRVAPEEHPVLLSEHLMNPRRNREKMLEMMFETFNVPSAYVALVELLQLFSMGRPGGHLVCVGDGLMTSLQVIDDFILPHSARVPIGGRDCTQYMMRMLYERGVHFTGSRSVREGSPSEFAIAQEIKEKLAYVAPEFWSEMDVSMRSTTLERQYELPDGRKISLGSERFRCMEPLFDPSLLGVESIGLPEMILKTATAADTDIRPYMWGTVLIGGGCTLAPGLIQRLKSELGPFLRDRLPAGVQCCEVGANPNAYSAWIGGSVLGSSSTLASKMISRQEYDETGPSIGAVKCP